MLHLHFSSFPELKTARLLLKKMVPGDAPALFELRSNADVMKYINRPLAKTVDDATALIQVITDMLEKSDAITWGIFLKDDLVLKGTIGFWRIQKENDRAEIGYLLHPSLQGQGLMHEAMAAVLDYGFQHLMLHSVEAIVAPENIASVKLLQRAGFVQEAYFRENYFSNGVFCDTAVYSLLVPS